MADRASRATHAFRNLTALVRNASGELAHHPAMFSNKRLALILLPLAVVAGCGTVAVLDLSTPKGVDNLDAYRLMNESFTWL
jgi:hypothetical protein